MPSTTARPSRGPTLANHAHDLHALGGVRGSVATRR
jgi:hypothetical protein